MGFFQDLLGGGKKGSAPSYQKVEIPPFWDDPYVGKTQDFLFDFGTNAVNGKLPDTYNPLIEFGSKQFEDMLGLKNRDIINSVTDAGVRAGMGRSGVLNSNIAKSVADSSTTARYNDYTNTLTNLKSILGYGIDTVSNVGSKALTNQGQKNEYNLNKARTEIGQNQFAYGADWDTFRFNEAEADSSNIGFEDILGGIGNVFGGAEGQDDLLGSLAGLFGGGGSKQGSAETGGGKKDTDWLKTGMDVAKLVAMFAA